MVFVNFLVKPFWVFGIDRTVQNKLGEGEYGLYFAIFNYTYLFQILLDFGLQNYNARTIASNNRLIDSLLPKIMSFKAILLIAYLILCIGIGCYLGYSQYPFLYVILVSQILLSFNIYLRSNVSAHQLFIVDSLLSITDKLLMIVFCAILLWGNTGISLTILNFTIAQCLAYAITFVVCLYCSIRLTKKFHFTISIQELVVILKQSAPYAIVYFLMTTYYRIDGVMLERMKGTIETGIYAQGYRIIESINNIGYLLGIILLPIFSYYLHHYKTNIKQVVVPAFNIILVIIIIIEGVFYFQAQEIIHILYINATSYSGHVFAWLVLNFIPIGILYVIGTLLTANESFKLMIPTLIIAVFLNIILNYLLIQSKGAIGAAMATFITQLFMLFVYGIYTLITFKLGVSVKYILKLVLFISIAIATMLSIKYIITNNNLLYLLLKTSLYIILVAIYSFLFGLIDKNVFHLKIGITTST